MTSGSNIKKRLMKKKVFDAKEKKLREEEVSSSTSTLNNIPLDFNASFDVMV